MGVYLGREWSAVLTKELARHFQRDPSIISRLYHQYAARRDLKTAARLLKMLRP